MSGLFSLSLFYLSFLPLWISVVFINVKSCLDKSENLYTEYISITCIILCFVLSFCYIYKILWNPTDENASSYFLKESKEEKSISAEYLLSYILPLMAFKFNEWDSVVIFLIFFTTFAFLCIKHNYFSVNITLEIIGFKFYKCKLLSREGIEIEKYIISRTDLYILKGDEITLKSLNNEYKLFIK